MAGLSRLREAVLSFHGKVIFNQSPIPVGTSTYSNNGPGKNLVLDTAEAQTQTFISQVTLQTYYTSGLSFFPVLQVCTRS